MSGRWRTVTISGQRMLDSNRVLEQLHAIPGWFDGLDKVTCPAGHGPGRARFLISSDRFADIDQRAPVDIVLETGDTAIPGNPKTLTFKNWIVTGYYDAVAVTDIRPLVLDLADPRFLFRDSAYAAQYNVRYPLGSRYEPTSLNGGSAWTWGEIFQDLWDAVPTSGLVSTFTKNNLPATTPENVQVIGEPAWDALCRVAAQQGLEVYYDPFESTITLDRPNGVLAIPDPTEKLATSGEVPEGLSKSYIPENVRVFFPKRAAAEPGNDDPHEIDSAGGDGTAGTKSVAWASLTAETDETGSVIEAARLASEAANIAAGVIDRRTNASKSQQIRYANWHEIACAPGMSDVSWLVRPFAQTVLSIRPSNKPSVPQVAPCKGTSLIFKLVEDFEPRTDLQPTSKVCDVFGLDTTVDPKVLVAESWSSAAAVQRTIWYAGETTITASAESPKYLIANMDYGGNYWVSATTGGNGSQVQGLITAVRDATTGDEDYTGLKIATITVAVAPCNRSNLLGTSIEVVDHSYAILDLPNADLVDYWLWAHEGVALSRDPEAANCQLTPCHWVTSDRPCEEYPGTLPTCVEE